MNLYFHCGPLKKPVVGYIDLEQNETYEKLKNRGWYSKWYWHFNDAIASNSKNDNTPASTVTATVLVVWSVSYALAKNLECKGNIYNHSDFMGKWPTVFSLIHAKDGLSFKEMRM